MIPRLHLVTDDAVLARDDIAELAQTVLRRGGGAVALHVRGHATSARALHALAEQLAPAARRDGWTLIVNDRVDVAMAVRAHGVQLGRRGIDVSDARTLLGAIAFIGYSAHDVNEAVQVTARGADWIFAGSIWETASHPDTEPAGVRLLEQCAAQCCVPVVAIGGVTPARVHDAARAGAHAVAVLGGIWQAPDPAAAAGEYLDAVHEVWSET